MSYKVMMLSHLCYQTWYECSCSELDAYAGALGAHLTGAGRGGCIVALVQRTESNYYIKHGITSAEASDAMFKSTPVPDADIFTLGFM
ncbi:hypothetical protein KXD40_005390 [Peronospora effusa]|nr:hypothetical protein KXD40_005390 [Peronospora effusa]